MRIKLTGGLSERLIVEMIKTRGGKRVRVDGMTYYLRLGQLQITPSAREDNRGKNWVTTEARVKPVRKFKGLRHMSTHVKEVYAGLPVWKTARALYAKAGHSSDVYRETLNRPYTDENGNVSDFKHYAISRGKLVMPREMTVTRTGDTVTLTWRDDRDEELARPSDRLHVFAVNEGKPDRLERVAGLTTRRADGQATFSVGTKPGTRVHVYPFFGNEDNTAFSDNDHFSTNDTGDKEKKTKETGSITRAPGTLPRVTTPPPSPHARKEKGHCQNTFTPFRKNLQGSSNRKPTSALHRGSHVTRQNFAPDNPSKRVKNTLPFESKVYKVHKSIRSIDPAGAFQRQQSCRSGGSPVR